MIDSDRDSVNVLLITQYTFGLVKDRYYLSARNTFVFGASLSDQKTNINPKLLQYKNFREYDYKNCKKDSGR